MKEKILIIGAGGFIGGFIAAEGLRRGYDVWVGVRQGTSMRYLDDNRLHTIVFDYESPAQVTKALAEALPAEGDRWKYVIHNLGATKCTRFSDFNRINFEYLRTVIEALKRAGKEPEKFLLMSSLSALYPGDERHYTPLSSATSPNPNTRYGLSKIKAEQYLQYQSGLPYVIFRATGVYGYHEKDYLMMIKSIDSHWDFGVGFRRQMLTFIYVEDLVNAMYDALPSPAAINKSYIISEPRAYSQSEFRQIVANKLGGRFVIPVRLPMWIVYVASVFAEKIGVLRGKPSTLNRDKYKIMKQRNWTCDVTEAVNDFGFKIAYPLERGIEETVKAYQREKIEKKK